MVEGQQRSRATGPVLVALVIVGAVAAGLAWYSHSRPAPEQVATAPAPPVAPAPAPRPSLPPMDEADAQVRAQAQGLSSSDVFRRWLQESDLARRFVSAVDTVARGDSPAKVLSFMAPRGRFATEARQGKVYMSPRGFERYNGVTDVLASIDVTLAAKAYRGLHPLIEAAYAEIGKPGTTIDGRLSQVVALVEGTTPPNEPVELVESGVNYAFADPALEALPAARRQLLRMGPRNLKILQAKLRALADALQLPPATG